MMPYREIDALAERAESAKQAIADLDRERAARAGELASIRAHLAPRKPPTVQTRTRALGLVAVGLLVALGVAAQTARLELVSESTGHVTPLFLGDGDGHVFASVE